MYKCNVSSCAYESPVYCSQCPSCKGWNTLLTVSPGLVGALKLQLLRGNEIEKAPPVERVASGVQFFDDILEGGLPKNTITTLAGMPGTGKSTLAMHAAHGLALNGYRVALASSEEGVSRLAARGKRLHETMSERLLLLSTSSLEEANRHIREFKADIAIYDSRQMFGGHILRDYNAAPTRLVLSQCNAQGSMRGEMTDEHLTDAVLFAIETKADSEDDYSFTYITLRVDKNRDASAELLAWYTIGACGLQPFSLFSRQRLRAIEKAAKKAEAKPEEGETDPCGS